MPGPITWSPAMPIPRVFDVQEHVAHLNDHLNPNSPYYERVEHHENLRTLKNLYETGQRKDDEEEICIMHGKVVSVKVARKSFFFIYLFIECIQSKDYDTI
jgi:predicted RNA-binding protein with EMAP domain